MEVQLIDDRAMDQYTLLPSTIFRTPAAAFIKLLHVYGSVTNTNEFWIG
jgi:hypothetical protein